MLADIIYIAAASLADKAPCATVTDASYATIRQALLNANKDSVEAKKTGGAGMGEFGYSSMTFANASGGQIFIPGARSPLERLDLFRRNVSFDGARVLDLGCNNGGMLLPLADEIIEGVGVDFDGRLIAAANSIAEATCTNLHFAQFNLMKQPLDELLALRRTCPGATSGTAGARHAHRPCSASLYDVITMYSLTRWLPDWKRVMTWAISHSRVFVTEINFSGHGVHGKLADGALVQSAVLFLRDACASLRAAGATHHPGVQDKQMYICVTPHQHAHRAVLEDAAEQPTQVAPIAGSLALEHQLAASVTPLPAHTGTRSKARPSHDAIVNATVAQAAQGLRPLSAQLQRAISTPEGRGRVLSSEPTITNMSQCGPLAVPFGGVLLREFEAYMNSLVVSPREHSIVDERVDLLVARGTCSQSASRPTQCAANSSAGMAHQVVALASADTAALRALGVLEEGGGAILRRMLTSSISKVASSTCHVYLLNVWNGYIEWVLGELGIFPKVFSVWMWPSLLMASVVERWRPLVQLRQPVGGAPFVYRKMEVDQELMNGADEHAIRRLAGEIVGHAVDLARGSTIVNVDWKPTDILVRQNPSTGAWEGRLSDIEASGSGHKSLAGMAPSVKLSCALLVNLHLVGIVSACGPMRSTAIAQAIAERAFAAMEDAVGGGDWRPGCSFDAEWMVAHKAPLGVANDAVLARANIQGKPGLPWRPVFTVHGKTRAQYYHEHPMVGAFDDFERIFQHMCPWNLQDKGKWDRKKHMRKCVVFEYLRNAWRTQRRVDCPSNFTWNAPHQLNLVWDGLPGRENACNACDGWCECCHMPAATCTALQKSRR